MPGRHKTHPRFGDKFGGRIGSKVAVETRLPAAPILHAALSAYFQILPRDIATPALGRRSTSTHRSDRVRAPDRPARVQSRTLVAPCETGSISVRAGGGSFVDGTPTAGAYDDDLEWTADGKAPRQHTLAAGAEHSSGRTEGRGNAAGAQTGRCQVGTASCGLSAAARFFSASCARTISIPSSCFWSGAPS